MLGYNSISNLFNAGLIFLTTFIGIVIISIIPLLFFVWWLSKFNHAIKVPRKQLKEIMNLFRDIGSPEEFCRKYESLNKSLLDIELIKNQWREFTESLIHSESDQAEPIRSVYSPTKYFSMLSLLSGKIDFRLFEAVPGILTGLGLLGTFLGLTIGIYIAKDGITTQNTTEMLEALTGLLGGASMAFITSIVGLIASITFSWWEKKKVNQFESMVDEFCGILDKLTIRITTQQLAFDSLKEARKQRVQLERFNTELALSIAEALDKKLAGSLAPSLNKLVDIMEDIKTSRSTQSESLIRDITEQFKESMTGAAGEELNKLSGVLDKVSNDLKEALDTIKSSSNSASDQLMSAGIELNDIIKAAGQSFQSQLSTSSGVFVTNLENANSSIQDSISSFGSYVDRLGSTCDNANNLLNRANDFNSELGQTIELVVSAHQHIKNTVDPMKDSAIILKNTIDKTTHFIDTIQELTSILTDINESSKNASEIMKTSWNNADERFLHLDNALQNSFTSLQDGVDKYTEKIKEFVLHLDTHYSKAIKEFASNIEELSDTLEDAITKLK